MPQITVDLSIFGLSQGDSVNIIISDTTMPVSALYNEAGDSLIRFKDVGNGIEAEIDSGFTTSQATIASAINTVLNSGFDTWNAAPFNLSQYGTNYKSYANFGQVVLGAYAHVLFGHVAATAAIDNDTSIINYMNGSGAGLADSLATEIMGLTTTICANVAQQVVDQDTGRAYSGTDGAWQSLEFRDGDIIHFAVTLMEPSVSGQSFVGNLSNYQNILYYIRVQLADPVV